MPYLVLKNKGMQKILYSKLIDERGFSALNSKIARKILKFLSENEGCAYEIAKELRENRQKIYYHLKKLEKAGIIKVSRFEVRSGGVAKIYELSSPSFSYIININKAKSFKTKFSVDAYFLYPFIKNGKINCLIVIGSPDPHGRFGAQATDGSAVIDLAMFFGMYCDKLPKIIYKLDTQLTKNDLKKNLIIVGGPKTNILLDKINKKLEIFFDEREWDIISKNTGKIYSDENVGIIIKDYNPFNKNSKILVLAGKRFKGTRGAIIAITKYPQILKNERVAKIIRAIDRDGDGIVDDVVFLE